MNNFRGLKYILKVVNTVDVDAIKLSWFVNDKIQRHDIQQNDTEQNDIQDNDTQQNDIQHNNKWNATLSIMELNAECCYAECRLSFRKHAHYAECHGTQITL